jgi:hypothetical protein
MTAIIEPIRVELPLATSDSPRTIISTCNGQSSLIKQCPAYGKTPAVQAAVVALDAAVAALQGTVSHIDGVDAQISALKTTRETQIATVHLAHDDVATALNTASNNDPQAAQAWVGKTKTRAKPAPVTTDTTPPAGAVLRTIKKTHGSAKASCTPEASTVSYLFQTGTDPAHPEAWPAPFVAGGHTFTFRGQPIGQTLYARIAIVRRGSVQSQWTAVIQIAVR